MTIFQVVLAMISTGIFVSLSVYLYWLADNQKAKVSRLQG